MSEVVGLNGERLAASDRIETEAQAATVALRGLLKRIEDGDVVPQAWFFVCEERHPEDHAMTRRRSLDSGLSICEAVYMLEAAKQDIFDAARGR